jgi:hypothetical protein
MLSCAWEVDEQKPSTAARIPNANLVNLLSLFVYTVFKEKEMPEVAAYSAAGSSAARWYRLPSRGYGIANAR